MTKRIARETSRAAQTDILSAATAAAVLEPPAPVEDHPRAAIPVRKQRLPQSIATTKRFAAGAHEEQGSNRQAELFYLQKQIQLQTQMVFILEDGAKLQGVIEWYDRQSIKVRGKSRMLIYKSAIKYLYKAGEVGVAPE